MKSLERLVTLFGLVWKAVVVEKTIKEKWTGTNYIDDNYNLVLCTQSTTFQFFDDFLVLKYSPSNVEMIGMKITIEVTQHRTLPKTPNKPKFTNVPNFWYSREWAAKKPMITPKPNKYKKLKVPMTIWRLNIFKLEFCKFLFSLKNSVITGCKFCNREKKTVIQKKRLVYIVWVCWKGMFIKKTIQEKWTYKNHYNDNYNTINIYT